MVSVSLVPVPFICLTKFFKTKMKIETKIKSIALITVTYFIIWVTAIQCSTSYATSASVSRLGFVLIIKLRPPTFIFKQS
jgi:hypothetical protein